MKKLWSTALLIGALLTGASSLGAQTVFSNGLPSGQAGWDMFNDFRPADDFGLKVSTMFNRISFWALLPTGVTYQPNVFWEILADGGAGIPSFTTVSSGSVLAQATLRTALGNGFDSWRFDLSVGPQSLAAGNYWLSLHDGLLGNATDSSLLWEMSSTGGGSQFAVQFLPTAEWTGDWGGDLAFELSNTSTVPEPASLLLIATGVLSIAVVRARRRRQEMEIDRKEMP